MVQRGTRLLAQHRVDVYQQDTQTVVGAAPPILSHLLEIRGLGILHVLLLFGAGAVRTHTTLSHIVHLELWTPDKTFDRLGSGTQTQNILHVPVPKITIPVKVGRNLALILTVAAILFRAKSMG